MVVLEHDAPKGFAENMNIGIRMALEHKCDLIGLNNDIVFTPSWLGPVARGSDAIVMPVCNQHYQHALDDLQTTYFMTLAEFAGRHPQLDQIAARHREAHSASPVAP